MKRAIVILVVLLSMYSCSKTEPNLVINGNVQGLKKGTLYLQKIEDTILVTIDSLTIKGDPAFTFKTTIEEPQVFYLNLKKLDGNNYNDRISFFAEPGEMTINTTLKHFEADAVVEGSDNQEKWNQYGQMMNRFNSQNLDLIKQNLVAKKENKKEIIAETALKYDNLMRRRYLFTVNFALNNTDFEIAPYLAISEIYDANVKYLDTIYTSLAPKIQDSKYGKSLKDLIQKHKEEPDSTAVTEFKN